ncbi:MAG: ATP-binding cassette domain-containing protein [Anaerolineae bacterium]|nr:MAG: ATP-binding cassette domain-containing protein [Anaerolineae bacterium]
MKPQPLIQMRQVVKTFVNAAGTFTALKGIDLDIYPGEFVAIVGKSGSGKSTLLNMLTGIDHPTSGLVQVNGVDIYAMSESERSLWRGKNLGIVFQFFQLLPMLTLHENVMLPMDYVGQYAFDERPQRAMELIRMVGLEKQAYKLPMAVSTGQQQSAAIARALANDPPIIVADEPTGNLDSRSAAHIIDIFQELSNQGKTIVMVTHDPSLTRRTSRTVIISDGELIDEAVAQALPMLTHAQMRAVMDRARNITIQPGQPIIQQSAPVDTFYIIAEGEVDVVLQGRKQEDVLLARLQRGDFFGEIELTRGGKAIASVRAAQTPVRLLALSRADFNWLMETSPLTSEAITRTVQNRLQTNRQQDRRKRPRIFRR